MSKKIIILAIIVTGTALLLSTIYISFFGKDILIGAIENNSGVKISLDGFIYRPPFSFTLLNAEVKNFFFAQEVSFSVNPLGFLAGKIILDGLTIDRPRITLEESPDGKLNLPSFKGKGGKPPFIPMGIVINDGKVILIDKKTKPQGFQAVLDKINFRILKTNLIPTSLRANYTLSGIFTDTNSVPIGKLDGKGWLDFGRKDMDGYLEVKGLDVLYFEPYYGNFISERKLLSANMNLKAILKSNNNDLSAQCHFELFNVAYAQTGVKKEKQAIFSNTLDLFMNEEGKIVLDFTLRSAFDKPAFNFKKFRSVAIKAAGQNLANQPPDKIIDRVGNAIEMFQQMFKKQKK